MTELYEQLIALVPRGLRAATYTQLNDVEIETNGLITFDRRACKAPPELLRRLNARLMEAFAIAAT
ncbi:MAG: hypothetical protein Q4D79_14960 [Propionibacteriaceae bacterium]|nr:hypothetical protein [Propionibacteriaceae bacterium]